MPIFIRIPLEGLVHGRGFPVNAWSFLQVTPTLLCRETIGPPEFPGYPRKYMIWSKTPVVTLNTFHDVFWSVAFQCIQTVGFHFQYGRSYPMTTTIHFSGLNTAPAFLIHLASDSLHRVDPQVSLLPRGIRFRQVGLVSLSVTHPLSNICQFHPCKGISRHRS